MSGWLDRNFPRLVYPATMLFSLGLFFLLRHSGQSLLVCGYLPVLIAILLVSLYEWRYPESTDWWPQRAEVGQDALYMLVVQIGLARLLTLLAALALSRIVAAGPSGLWPHDWPLILQFLLMLLTADFLRYWLHRLCHWHPLLWRLHAVHHSPQRLYWLNVGRFHPLEKALQFLFDALPFILLGVSDAVITLYFVFYAVNGFFQHSNIRLHMGWLNYVISSAELHRWHHSRIPAESNTNFGNNVIVWDLLFGTRYFPESRTVGELGLVNRAYPRSFLLQCLTPFTPDIVNRDVPVHSARRVVRRLSIWAVMQWLRVTLWWPLYWQARFPRRCQRRVLRRILNANRNTRFGRQHQFSRIGTDVDFARQVPVQEYEDLRPYIEHQETERLPALTAEQPCMYAVTSGTTGQPKFLPVLRSSIRQYRREQRLFSWILYRHCPGAFYGKMLGFVSPAEEGRLPSGTPFGSVSGHIYASMPAFMQKRILVPPPVYEIDDYALKYRVMLYLALLREDITYVGTANPSSCLRLLRELQDSWAILARSLETGSLEPLGRVPAAVAASIANRLIPAPAAAERLRVAAEHNALDFKTLWPNINLLTVWTGGSCGIAVAALRTALPDHTRVIELGYVASEFRGSVTIDVKSGAGLPTLQHHYFEFIESAHWDAGEERYLSLAQLERGRDYYVIVTTCAGLYRYFMNDIVRVVDRFGNTPTIRFMQKGRGVTSITGEKLYESQLLQAISELADKYGFAPDFVMGLADAQAGGYRIYVEASVMPAAQTLASALDAALRRINLEYRVKRDSDRLQPVRWYWLTGGSGDAYKEYCLARGQREGQFKTVALQRRDDFPFDLDARRLQSATDTES